MSFCGRVVQSGITFSFAFSGNLSDMDNNLLKKNNVLNSGGAGTGPHI